MRGIYANSQKKSPVVCRACSLVWCGLLRLLLQLQHFVVESAHGRCSIGIVFGHRRLVANVVLGHLVDLGDVPLHCVVQADGVGELVLAQFIHLG